MTNPLDDQFGTCRAMAGIENWEKGQRPVSLTKLDEQAAFELRSVRSLAQSSLLKHVLLSMTYIWAMDADGEIWIAVEELAYLDPDFRHHGYPRRRGGKHPSEQKKLGHPTVLAGGDARIAGELALDVVSDGSALQWVLNANSGRYCRQKPPTPSHLDSVAARFRELGLDVTVDPD